LTFDLQIRTRQDCCTVHLTAKFRRPTFNRSEVIVRTNKLTNKQTPLKTSTSLRYATPVGKYAVSLNVRRELARLSARSLTEILHSEKFFNLFIFDTVHSRMSAATSPGARTLLESAARGRSDHFSSIFIHRRSVAKRGGCFERRLFVCQFVCTITS